PSDIHSLYIGAVHLAQSLDAEARPADRLKSAQQWQACLKDFGLTPTARESLRWQVAQGLQAEKCTQEIRATKEVTPVPAESNAGDVDAKIISLYDQFR